MQSKPQIFLDCDGVLADFDNFIKPYMDNTDRDHWDKHFSDTEFWGRLEHIDDLFGSLDRMPDADELVDGVMDLVWDYGLENPIILTGKPRLEKYKQQKLDWRDKHYPLLEMIVCESKNKRKHMKAPGDIIIDDWTKHQQVWIDAGGNWILHKNAKQSLKELEQILSDWSQ